MATVQPKFRPSTVDGKEGTLFYRIIHNRRSHRIRTGYKLFPSEWDERSGGILIPPGSDEGRKNYLAVLQDRVAGDTDRLNRIIASYEQELRTYTYADILGDGYGPAKPTIRPCATSPVSEKDGTCVSERSTRRSWSRMNCISK